MTTTPTTAPARCEWEGCVKQATHVVRESPPLTGREELCEEHRDAAVEGELVYLTRDDFEVVSV